MGLSSYCKISTLNNKMNFTLLGSTNGGTTNFMLEYHRIGNQNLRFAKISDCFGKEKVSQARSLQISSGKIETCKKIGVDMTKYGTFRATWA